MGRTSSARQRLLNAARDLPWESSYHSITVDAVCARAGVRKGSLYHFELAVGDAIAKEVIEPSVARAEALPLRAAMQGILARARMLNEPDELGALRALPVTVLRVKQPQAHEIEEGRTDTHSTCSRHVTNHKKHNPEEAAALQALPRSNFARMRRSAPFTIIPN